MSPIIEGLKRARAQGVIPVYAAHFERLSMFGIQWNTLASTCAGTRTSSRMNFVGTRERVIQRVSMVVDVG